MNSLWDVNGSNLDVGYKNIREARHPAEVAIRHALDKLWADYEQYADPDFKAAFARDPDARFWEMYLASRLLAGGKVLLPSTARKREGGQPDLCVLDDGRRIWIEAIAPDRGADGPDQVRGPRPINEGGGLAVAPIRQAQLRTTSALLTKSRVIKRYVAEGTIGPDEVRLIAINAGRFGVIVPEEPLPLVMSAVFPLGPQYLTIDRDSGDVVDEGFQFSPSIARTGDSIPRTAFLDERFDHVSGLLWSRTSIGSLGQPSRPLTLVHNPLAKQPMAPRWGVWDREFITSRQNDHWLSTDVLAGAATDR